MAEIPDASVRYADFACPHCGAHATQYWYSTHAERLSRTREGPGLPYVPNYEDVSDAQEQLGSTRDPEKIKMYSDVLVVTRKMIEGMPFIDELRTGPRTDNIVRNLSISQCHTCSELAIWVYDKLIYPPTRTGPLPNADLPSEIVHDYEEASSILALSPQGAAALLRLAIQKLCIAVGSQGDDINAMISWLVANGLPERVQQALDAVRVIGNEAVHPGTMDLRDDGATAYELFVLVNIICDSMISQPKRIERVFSKLPASKRDAIQQRDARSKGDPVA
jgi:hypothetical protein